MDCSFQVRDVPVLLVMYRAGMCPPERLQPVFREMLEDLFHAFRAHNLEIGGPPFLRILSQDEPEWRIEAGFPLLQPVLGTETYRVGQLGGKAAWAMHCGHFENLPATHAALRDWIRAQGLHVAGPAWEVYLTDPEWFENPEDWRTEVYIPVW